MATAIANNNGRLANMALPDADITCDTASGSQEKLALPTPSKMPATGSTDTGSIMHLPIFCRSEKAFLKADMVIIRQLVLPGRGHRRRIRRPTLSQPGRDILRSSGRGLAP